MTTRLLTLKQLAAELPRVLEFARVDQTHHVIIENGRGYVQFAFPEGWILGEAVSNEYLPAARRLTEYDEVLLEILGWRRPGTTDRDGYIHRNFHRDWHADTASVAIATDVLRTLTGVYGTDEGALFELNVFGCDYCDAHVAGERTFADADEDVA